MQSIQFHLFCVTLAIVATAHADFQGVVFDDANQNGILDAGEAGIAAVRVSNGVEVVRTDTHGYYALDATESGFIFVIQPNGWAAPLTEDQRARYHLPVEAGRSKYDFGLIEAPKKSSVQALFLADTQTSDEGDVDYLNRSTVETILGTGLEFDFGVTLGDVVNDRLDLLPSINETLGRIGIPQYYVNGNHDLDFEATNSADSVETFESIYGPSDFAFESGPALFIGLNNIIYPSDVNAPWKYFGGLREAQFAWLENLLAETPIEQPVVLMVHIPFFQPGVEDHDEFSATDKQRLFDLLLGRPVMFLSGHTHYQRHYFHGLSDGWKGASPIHEYNVAAACGSFWTGPLDAKGIPSSIMWDGTPPGFGVLKIDESGFRTEYFPTNFPADYQIGFYVPEVIPAKKGWISFYANVFDGHDGWKVEARTSPEGPWRPMKRILAWDPSYVEMFLAQNAADAKPVARRLPDPVICFHLWRSYLPGNLEAGAVDLTIRATAPDGRVFTTTQTIEVRPSEL